mgnify:CR=1 FL=1
MANVNIKFNNKDYLLSCDDGQEESLKKLTSFLDQKYKNLKNELGNIGENKLLLITTIKLIDDSSTNKGGNTTRKNFSPEYNIVSGTLQDGGTTIKDESSDDSTFGTYGLFYPEIGTLILNANRVESQFRTIAGGLVVSSSNALGGNNDKFFALVKDGAFFQAKREESITSRHFFVRATANRFNATTNETFYTESVAGVKRIIPALQNDPKTFITSVGLYNDNDELLAIAKLSKPIIKSRSREALIKVKLDF